MNWLHGTLQDIRYSIRTLARSPGFTLIAIATLAIGIGANTAVFTIANTALFGGFPLVHRNDRVLYITTARNVSYPDFEDWRAQAKSFAGMAAAQGLFKFVGDGNADPTTYSGIRVTTNAFRLLGVRPILGRGFVSSDAEPGAAPVTIVSYGLWDRQFGKQPAIIGRSIRLNGIATTIVGVMPRGFLFPQKQDLWLPMVRTPAVLMRGNGTLSFAFGRLAAGASIQSARAEMRTIGERLMTRYPDTNQGITPTVRSFDGLFIGRNATTAYEALWGAVAFVLLIVCANMANLLLGRAVGRSRALSIRGALGATGWRIVRQLLIESMTLSALSGVIGWWVAQAGVRLYVVTQGNDSWFADVVGGAMDSRVLIYLTAVSVGTGLLFGLLPAIRLSTPNVVEALKDGGHGAVGTQRGTRLSALLIVGEMALAVVLMGGAGVMIRSFLNIYNADVGAKTARVLTGYVYLAEDRYSNAGARVAFAKHLETSLETIPGVESFALATSVPTEGARRFRYRLFGEPIDKLQRGRVVAAVAVSPAYFRTVGAVTLAGRTFNDLDQAGSTRIVIVNQRFARLNWPGKNAVGKRLELIRDGKPRSWLTVAGIVSDIVQNDPTRQNFGPVIYVPYSQSPSAGFSILARTRVPPASLEPAFQRRLHAIDPALPFQHLVPLRDWISRIGGSYTLHRSIAALLLVFSAIGLLLAAVGLYAVIAYSVTRRTREIGIRAAMGATRSDIGKLIIQQGAPLLAVGLGLGLVASLALNRLIEAELIGVSPSDPISLAGASTVLVLAATVGCLIPVFRATRIDPVVALRHE